MNLNTLALDMSPLRLEFSTFSKPVLEVYITEMQANP